MSSTKLQRLASMAQTQILGGLSGVSATVNFTMKMVEDEIVGTFMQVITKYARLNVLPEKDLYISLNCIPVDCKSLSDCCEDDDDDTEKYLHFQIPQIAFVAADKAISWIGNSDKTIKFRWYTSPTLFNADRYRKYTPRNKKPIVYINPTPNKDGLLDGYIKGLDYLESISISAIFKDLRQVSDMLGCCYSDDIDNISAIDNEVVDTVVKKFFTYYRQAIQPPLPITDNAGNVYPGVQQPAN